MLNQHSAQTANGNLLTDLLAESGSAFRSQAYRLVGDNDDVADAMQQASLIFLEKFREPHPNPAGWFSVTLRRECLAILRSRGRSVPASDYDAQGEQLAGSVIEMIPEPGPGPAERADFGIRAERLGTLIAQLKPDQRRALGLIAQGFSYEAITAETGWTHTKINRCLAEGRARLRALRDGSE